MISGRNEATKKTRAVLLEAGLALETPSVSTAQVTKIDTPASYEYKEHYRHYPAG